MGFTNLMDVPWLYMSWAQSESPCFRWLYWSIHYPNPPPANLRVIIPLTLLQCETHSLCYLFIRIDRHIKQPAFSCGAGGARTPPCQRLDCSQGRIRRFIRRSSNDYWPVPCINTNEWRIKLMRNEGVFPAFHWSSLTAPPPELQASPPHFLSVTCVMYASRSVPCEVSVKSVLTCWQIWGV